MNSTAKEITLIIIGSLFFALGVNLFAIPNELGEGGVTGISMTLYYVFGWSPGYTNFIMNGILLAIGYKVLNKRVTWYTLLAIFFTSVFLHFTEGMGRSLDIMLGTVFAGVFIGIGLGLVLRSGGTTGGSTIVARMLNQKFGWAVSTSMFVFDILVVIGSGFVIGIENTMYTGISIYISTKILDYLIDGFDTRKAVTIISPLTDAIAEKVSAEMDRGATIINARGHYSKESKDILYVVINKQELFLLKKTIQQIDDKAFVVVHDVRDVFGEGFTFPKT
ncbi:YitT family protein [Rossellomorea marisflavi]|uniref:YitT family protein n=1 Tax=Rossellomorea TaxID=2837508 RepID=UPI00203BD7AB|nr:YitT family protein [Rossellomorea marisflavi]MCM2587944.1 YitT family protein [Rossellomorea marisflavi]MDR4938332.1 YitT family protein [Rossellomorea marisflavi]